MKKQLSPSQTLWLFGAFTLIAFILSASTFVTFRHAFDMDSDEPVSPENEKTAELANVAHGVDVMRGGKTVVVSTGQNDVSEEDSRGEEQPTMVENIVVPEVIHQPEEKAPAKPVVDVKTVEEKMARTVVKPEDNASPNAEAVVPIEQKGITGTKKTLLVQNAAILPVEKNTPAGTDTGVVIGGYYEKFPECRLYYVQKAPRNDGKILMVTPAEADRINTEFFKETLEKLNTMTPLAAFYDKDTKFNIKQVVAQNADLDFKMIEWSGVLLVKKAGTYTFLYTLGSDDDILRGIAVFVNGKGQYVAGIGKRQGVMDVELKPDMANVKIVVYAADKNKLSSSSPLIRYKLKNAIGDFREIIPGKLYHKIEEDW